MSQPDQKAYVHEDYGLGMTYERYAVQCLLQDFATRHPIRSVLEGPLDGMMGIKGVNSIVFAKLGIPVVVVLPSQRQVDRAREVWQVEGCLDRVDFVVSRSPGLDLGDRTYDLVWNLCALPLIPEYRQTIADMCRVSGNLVLIGVNNTANYGFGIHRLHHRRTGVPWYHGNLDAMDTNVLSALLSQNGAHIVETGYVDIPFWPDIDTKLNVVLGDLVPPLRPLLRNVEYMTSHRFAPENWPYYRPNAYPQVHKQLKRLRVLERCRQEGLRRTFAHHRYLLARVWNDA